MPHRALAATLLIEAALGFGCPPQSPEVVVVAVDVVGARSDGPSLQADALESAVREALAGVQGLSLRPARPDEVPHQVRIEVGVASAQPAAGGGVRRTVGLGLDLFSLSDREGFSVTGLAHVEGGDDDGWRQPRDEALATAVDRLGQRLALEHARPARVVEALAASDEFVRRAAIAVAARRELNGAVEPLSALIRAEDTPEPVILEAVGALAAIGDPAGAPAVIDAARGRPPAYLPQLIHALTRIGGPQARGYLFTLRQGHPSAAIRAEAKDALRALEAFEEEGAP